MELILLERIARLGNVGDVVKVKPGFGRNFLLPQKKALRATEDNKKLFETRRAALEKQNVEARNAAQQRAASMQNLSVSIIRQAAEDGKLYGSVSARDVAEALKEIGHEIERRYIDLSTAIKSLGVYSAVIHLHPEVPVTLKVQVARNAEGLLAQELAATDRDEAAPVAEHSEEDAEA